MKEIVGSAIKEKLSDALVESAYKEMGTLAERSMELYLEESARLGKVPVVMLEKEQIWPDYKEIKDMFAIYSRLFSEGKADKMALVQDPALRRRLQLLYVSPEQHFLTRLSQEENTFAWEVERANVLWQQIQLARFQRKLFKPETNRSFIAIIKELPNLKLRRSLLKALDEQDYVTLNRDLSEYYSIGMDDAVAASRYAQHNPHGRNLAMRRLLVNPFVPQTYKKYIKNTLSAPTIENVPAFEKVLEKAFKAQTDIRGFLKHSKAVRAKVETLIDFINRVEAFVKEYKRLPDINIPEEHNFALECNLFQFARKDDRVAAKYYNRFDNLLKKYNIEPLNTFR